MIPHPIACLVLCAPFGAAQEPTPEPKPVERGLRIHTEGAFEGWTLLSPLSSGTTYLVDMKGEVVHQWDTGLPVAAMAYLKDDGHLVRTVRINENPRFFGGGLGGRIQELDWDGKVVWDFTLSDEICSMHHEFELLPNGHLIVIAWEHLSREEGIALGREPEKTSPKGFWPCMLLELEPVLPDDAKIVWEWHARDHLVQDFDAKSTGHGAIADHPGRIDINADHRDDPPLTEERRKELEKRKREMAALGYTGGDDDADDPPTKQDENAPKPPEPDWMHTNSLDWQPAHDLLVVSSPHLCEIFVVDHSTTTAEARGESGGRWKKGGALLWRWGHPRNYGAGENADQKLFYQHDPQWLSTDSTADLRVTVFNNGQDRPQGKWSSVEELVLPFDPKLGFVREAKKPFGPERPAWIYTAPEKESFFSGFISGAQRLANGNTLVCSGAQGRLFEVTREGKTVWEFWNPHGGEIPASFGNAADRQPTVDAKAVFQAVRIAPDHPGLRGRKLEPLISR